MSKEKFSIKESEREYLIKELFPYCDFFYILGSYGTSRFNEKESDIDIAAHFKKEVTFEQERKLLFSLSDHFDRDVDLVNLRTSDPIFIRQVLETGHLMFVENPAEHHLWVATKLSQYIDFKIDRSIIEKNLLKRKKITG
ncbi:MAG TPA: nucleotidyltransferase domain-containing protein [Pseudobdellovibrionaceae bacterium]|nr:nucleotidyltransferase domain-containing protein [Pseudobdellovibrionaceae bacterium]